MKDYSFGNYICALRTGLGLSQFQLGTLVGVTDKAVSKWENGDAKPRISTCYRLAEVLGVTLSELLSCKQYVNVPARKELDTMNNKLWDEAYDRLSIYGENPSAICWSRLAAEKAALCETDAIQSFAVLGAIAEKTRENGSVIMATGMASSSFTAWLLGATKVNPLPPHYRCPNCKKIEFVSDVVDGFDLPPKKCSCGEECIRDGHNIPFEGFAKSEQRRTSVDLRVSSNAKLIAIETIQDFYSGTATILPIRLMFEDGRPSEVEFYAVMNNNDTWPSMAEDGFWHVTSEGFWNWRENRTTFCVLCYKQLRQIETLQEMTGVKCPDPLSLISGGMMEKLYKDKRQGSKHVAGMTDRFCVGQVHNFSLLMRISGYCFGSSVWCDRWNDNGEEKVCSNGEALVAAGRADFRSIPAFREDIWNDISTALACNGIRDNGLALEIMENARMGKYRARGMTEKVERLLHDLGLPEWYPEYLKKVMYLFPKGHCVDLLLFDITIEWFHENHPEAWAQVVSCLS